MRCLVLFSLFWATSAFGFPAPRVEIEVKVRDEAGEPVKGATVEGAYHAAVAGEGSLERAHTDENGVATVVGHSVYPVDIYASKPGYYISETKVTAREVVDGKEHCRDRKITVVLKEKKNPIPLYARRYSGEIPVAGEWIGFDMEKADWVAPYGKGISPDLNFWFTGEFNNINSGHGELRLRLAGSDGIAEITELSPQSKLKVPHLAPRGGYAQKEKVWHAVLRRKVEDRLDRNKLYCLRVRSSVNAKGEIEEANYAKLCGNVVFSLRGMQGGVSRIQFQYYFNPSTNDRNLEFDSRNLFEGLSHQEQVRAQTAVGRVSCN